MNRNYDFLISGPVPRVIGTMAIPTIVSMMTTSIYSVADTFFVSRLNTQSTAAIGIIFTVMTLFQAAGFLFGHGSGNYIAIRLGADDETEARLMASTGCMYGIVTGVCLSALMALYSEPLCVCLGCTPTILPYAKEYLQMILLSGPFITFSLILNIQMRQQGNAAYAMIGILSGAVANTLLDPLFIFGMDMGIRGAGLATLVSQAVSCGILLFMTTKGGNMTLSHRNIRFGSRYVGAILAGGTPSLTRQGLGSLATLLMNVSAAVYGDTVVAAMTIVTRITFLVYSAVIGLGQGYQPLCGFCYGARLYGRVMKGFWFSVGVGTVFLTGIAVAGYVMSEEIIALFSNNAEVISVGGSIFRWQLLTYPLGAFIMLGNMIMQSVNKPIRANILAAARRGLFFIPLLLILPRYFGLYGLEICQPIADLCAFSLSLPVVVFTFCQFRRQTVPAKKE